MVNQDVYFNPKALNLEVLKNTDGNVTLGFKIEPSLKLLLAAEASKSGLTLSTYVKNLVSDSQSLIDEIKNEAKELSLIHI